MIDSKDVRAKGAERSPRGGTFSERVVSTLSVFDARRGGGNSSRYE